VGPPRLVGDEGGIVLMGDLGERSQVGDGPEVGRRDDERRDRVGGPLEGRGERVSRQAVGDPELGVELGCDEDRLEPGKDQPVDRARVDVTLDHDPWSGLAQGEAGGVVSLRGAVDQEPALPRAPGFGREPLRLLERGRLGPDVDALDQRRDIVIEQRSRDLSYLSRGKRGWDPGANCVASSFRACATDDSCACAER
jgi:hypothetical protein